MAAKDGRASDNDLHHDTHHIELPNSPMCHFTLSVTTKLTYELRPKMTEKDSPQPDTDVDRVTHNVELSVAA